MDINRFKKTPLMGILRGIDPSVIEPLIEVLVPSGLESLEITMNTPQAADIIKTAVKVSGNRMMIGAGTVTGMESMKKALDAGAGYIVMPTLVNEVTEYCRENKIPVFPGAFTPQEIFNAWKAGATMVKVFPARFCGPDYIKEVKGPFDDIEIMACGGINADNILEYFSKGASAVAFGGSVFNNQLLEEGKYSAIADEIRLYIQLFRKSAKSN
ncbi:MAG: bifunctional 4-hydroxy-2-oxoglutarate aldolase/2-dehydro-3-deoxy-phosphogluconate aldolase [Elusimicrobiota bacterium]